MKRLTINKYNVIALMSGTSLDGVDIAYCLFEWRKNRWHFSIKQAQTFNYSEEWKIKLSSAHLLSGEKLQQLHSQYGQFLGDLCLRFIRKYETEKIDLIASHGHTVFHQPKNKFTLQLGDGNAIHAMTCLPVVYDFRSLDVLLGGQGAPLVPIGDRFLFNTYDVCLNLGGIANLSMEARAKRIAFDVCFCNMALNHLARQTGAAFDKGGACTSKGLVNAPLLKSLTKFYQSIQSKRPSLAREQFEKGIHPLIEDDSVSIPDRLRTVTESIAIEIARVIPRSKKKSSVLITGGGAHNHFLIECLVERLSDRAKIIVPDKTTIDFKEALVFGFLGVLRLRAETNVLKSVTGASRDSCSGVLVGSRL